MKDYSIKGKENDFITGFDIIDERIIDVTFADGRTTQMPYNVTNLNILRKTMLTQARKAQNLLQEMKQKNKTYKVMTVLGTTCLVLSPNLSKCFNPEVTVIGACALGGISLGSCYGVLKNSSLISDISKLNIFIKHKDSINEAISENPYMYSNVSSEKDFNKIRNWIEKDKSEPLVIENIDDISYKTLRTIWENVKLSKKFEFEYNTEDISGFQKTK